MVRLNLKVVIFDFDGTLVDTMGIFADVAAELIHHQYGLPLALARQEYLRTSGLPFIKQLEELFPNDNCNASVAEKFESRKNEAAGHVVLDHMTNEALHELQKKYKIAISSGNFEKNIRSFFKKNSFTPDLILGFKEGFTKGADHFNFVLKHFGVQKENLLFIGDSLNDFLKAREFGVAFIARLGTFKLLDFQKIDATVKGISSIKELENYV